MFLLFVCGVFFLILAVYMGIPRLLSAHSEHAGADTKEKGQVRDLSEGENQIAPEDWIHERSGDLLPLDTEFTDSSGKSISLRSIIDRPTLILPIYYYCPNSCSLNLSYLATAIAASGFKPGEDFKVIAFSFNADEKVEDAMHAKKNYLKQLPDNFPADTWEFLVGGKKSIHALTDALGYRFKRMPDGTFVHPSALAAISAEGLVIKYVYGSFLPGDVDMALQEAKKGTPALSVKRLLGFCFNSDSKTSNTFLQKLKVGLLIGSLILGCLFVVFLRRSGKKKDRTGRGESE